MGTVVLDASVLLALFDPIDDHHAPAAAAVRRHRDAGDTFKVPASAVAGALVGACRQRCEARRMTQIERAFGPPRPIDSAVAIAAARLRAKHRSLRLPDAIILAVAQVDNADVILTADKAWRKYDQRARLVS